MNTQTQVDDKPTVTQIPDPTETSPPATKQRRGFGAMDPAKVRAIARKGGVAAHARGTAHRYTAEEARIAGSKGGRAAHKTRGRGRAPQAAASNESATA